MKQLAMYINGRFENDFNGEWRDVLNPSTEETIAREPKGGKADVDRAVAAARAAQPAWERLPAVERGAYLRKIAQGIRERADELTDTIVAEGGKTKDLARVEVMFTADYLDYQAEWARRYEGEIEALHRFPLHVAVEGCLVGIEATVVVDKLNLLVG